MEMLESKMFFYQKVDRETGDHTRTQGESPTAEPLGG